MSKAFRGKTIRRNSGFRGTCPICGRTRVKIVWTKVMEDGTKSVCCKLCGRVPKKKKK